MVGAATITRDITLLRKERGTTSCVHRSTGVAQPGGPEIAETLSVEQVINSGLKRMLSATGLDLAFVHFPRKSAAAASTTSDPSCLAQVKAKQSGRNSAAISNSFWQLGNPWFVDDVKATPEFAAAAATNPVKSLAVLPLEHEPSLHAAITLLSFKNLLWCRRKILTPGDGAPNCHGSGERAALWHFVQAHEELRREIEERKQAEQTLADFTAMVAHDLRSPLANVLTITESVRDGLFGPINELQQKWLSKVQELQQFDQPRQ